MELFFKWIKQHLRIEVFFGTSENAVKTQIWIAILTSSSPQATWSVRERRQYFDQLFSLFLH